MRSFSPVVLTFFLFLNQVVVSVFGAGESLLLEQRFAPYASWIDLFEAGAVQTPPSSEAWWRSPERIRRERLDPELPLSGLHLALDPGHIGGPWAEAEGRHFRIRPEDFIVREGELALEVALNLQSRLIALGAQVTLLRKDSSPVNPKKPLAYLAEAVARVHAPDDFSEGGLIEYAQAIRKEMIHRSIVVGELSERARLVNEVIRPDALISVHINAAPWPRGSEGGALYQLVDSNHSHVLIFGCVGDSEFAAGNQKQKILAKMTNGSAPIEQLLGDALGKALGRAFALPPSEYSGKNAVRLAGASPYLWARNLMLLRSAQCPVVLLEPFLANSTTGYLRLQSAIASRQAGKVPEADDILVEYASAVIKGLLEVYGPEGP